MKPYSKVKINDFTDSWTNGVTLSCLVHSLNRKKDPEEYFDKISGTEAIKLNEEAIEIAETQLNISPIITAEDITNNPEELSMMTYISYFRDYERDHPVKHLKSKIKVRRRSRCRKVSNQRIKTQI
jgi:filamin